MGFRAAVGSAGRVVVDIFALAFVGKNPKKFKHSARASSTARGSSEGAVDSNEVKDCRSQSFLGQNVDPDTHPDRPGSIFEDGPCFAVFPFGASRLIPSRGIPAPP